VEITLGDVGLRDFKPLHRLSLGFYNLVHRHCAGEEGISEQSESEGKG